MIYFYPCHPSLENHRGVSFELRFASYIVAEHFCAYPNINNDNNNNNQYIKKKKKKKKDQSRNFNNGFQPNSIIVSDMIL